MSLAERPEASLFDSNEAPGPVRGVCVRTFIVLGAMCHALCCTRTFFSAHVLYHKVGRIRLG